MPASFPYASHSRVYVYMEVSGRVLGSELPGILVFTEMFREIKDRSRLLLEDAVIYLNFICIIKLLNF